MKTYNIKPLTDSNITKIEVNSPEVLLETEGKTLDSNIQIIFDVANAYDNSIDGVTLVNKTLQVDNTNSIDTIDINGQSYVISISNRDNVISVPAGSNEISISGSNNEVTIKNYTDIFVENDCNIYHHNGNCNIEYYGGNITSSNLLPENIKGGINILGVTGTYYNTNTGIDGVNLNDGDLEIHYSNTWDAIHIWKNNAYVVTKSENSTIVLGNDEEEYDQTINLTYIKGNVVTNNLSANNVKSGVTILGITGTYAGIEPSGTMNITENGTYNVSTYEQVKVSVAQVQTNIVSPYNAYY